MSKNLTRTEIRAVIWKLRNKKAPGEDRIEAEILKHAAKGEVLEIMCRIMNGCLAVGYFPEIWKTAMVKILLKNEKKYETEYRSYRPICLLSVLSKVLERLMSKALKRTLLHPQYSAGRQYG